jgi:thiamine biosynthesis lipoprotein
METQILRQEQNHMATTFDFRLSCGSADLDRADRLLERAHAEVTRLEEELTEFPIPSKAASPVLQLNSAATFEKITFTEDAFALLERALQLSKVTATAFNPLAKSATPATLANDLGWNSETREVWKLSPGIHLGFGAIGKGYALDQVRLMLAQEGFQNFLLSGGGSSVFISGFQAPGVPWSWGWSWRKNEAGENLGVKMTHETGQAIAIGVSGTHEKGEHIIGLPGGAQSASLKSALIAHSSATEADALSTGLFVLGWEQGVQAYSQSLSSVGMAVIDGDEIPHWNGIFQGLWKNLAQSFLSLSAIAVTGFWFASLFAHSCIADDVAAGGDLDLSSLDAGSNTFTPYLLERSNYWVLLPLFALFIVLVHLKKNKPRARRTDMNKPSTNNINQKIKKIGTPLTTLFLASTCWLVMEQAKAAEIEPMGKAIMAVLGTPKAQKKVAGNTTIFYSKDASGHVATAAFIQSGVYEPNCGHKWVVGIDGRTGTVTQVRPIEMACPHAFPTKAASFLDQYKGKGPADVAKLDSEVATVAKATGSCKLTTEAVKKSITTYQQVKGTL